MVKYHDGGSVKVNKDRPVNKLPPLTLITEAADQDGLPFKMIYTLCHQGLRLLIQPESTHSLWNDVKNSVRRAGMQHTLLLSSVLSNAAHGPFGSGRNHQSLLESADHLAKNMDPESFDALVDSMMMDRHLSELDHDIPGIPSSPDDLPQLPCVKNLPTYVHHTLQNKLFLFFSTPLL